MIIEYGLATYKITISELGINGYSESSLYFLISATSNLILWMQKFTRTCNNQPDVCKTIQSKPWVLQWPRNIGKVYWDTGRATVWWRQTPIGSDWVGAASPEGNNISLEIPHHRNLSWLDSSFDNIPHWSRVEGHFISQLSSFLINYTLLPTQVVIEETQHASKVERGGIAVLPVQSIEAASCYSGRGQKQTQL